MRKALVGVGLLAALGAGAPALATAGDTAGDTGPRPAVESLRGHARDGFRILWSDGTRTHTPTLSEAVTECHAYHNRVRRASCVASVRTGYRWMAELRRSLNLHDVNG